MCTTPSAGKDRGSDAFSEKLRSTELAERAKMSNLVRANSHELAAALIIVSENTRCPHYICVAEIQSIPHEALR